MNVKEGSRRVSLTIIWLIVIYIGIPGIFYTIKYAHPAEHGIAYGIVLFGMVVTFVVGFVIKVITDIVYHWVLKGFVGDEVFEKEIMNNLKLNGE